MTTNHSPDAVSLKPCPFCGGEPRLSCGSPGCWFVSCARCKAMSDDRGKEAAIDAWNTRQPASAALVAPMTDAELEREAEIIANCVTPQQEDGSHVLKRVQLRRQIEMLAKKYRG